jgi:hypothetical protein
MPKPAKPKPLTVRRIQAILRKAGHTPAESHATRVRGWRSWSPGYVVGEAFGVIRVTHRDSDQSGNGAECLRWYHAALVEAHVACELVDGAIVIRVTPPS